MTPDYYKTGPETDLFDVFVYRYGLETVQAHLEMAAIEYLYRAGLKGQYQGDLRKVGPLLERLLTWQARTMQTGTDTAPIPEATLDDALSVLAQHGYGVIAPPLPPREGSGIAAVDHVGVYDRLQARQEERPVEEGP